MRSKNCHSSNLKNLSSPHFIQFFIVLQILISPVSAISPPSPIKNFCRLHYVKRRRETLLHCNSDSNTIKGIVSTRGGETSQIQTAPTSATIDTENTSSNSKRNKKYLKLEQVQVVHRHGDRTPITPMRNETFWQNTIPSPEILKNIALGTKLVRDPSNEYSHGAKGKGAFGQLTTLGMFQMVDLGSKLRDELILAEASTEESEGNKHARDKKDEDIIIQNGFTYELRDNFLFESQNSLSCDSVRVLSTDFPRTIQSVQALLIGLFPDSLPNTPPLSNRLDTNTIPNTSIEIDVRHTDIMIPDPQPRRTIEQTNLEKELSQRKYILEKDMQMKELAVNVTKILKKHVLGLEYDEVSFGVGEEKDEKVLNSNSSSSSTTAPLPWAQLSEITKCLAVRGMLPPNITPQIQHEISAHAAWRWFENLRHPRLAWLSMNGMTQKMMKNIMDQLRFSSGDDTDDNRTCSYSPRLHIYSAHDSTLIGLMCAFRLEQPAEWPEYASYLKMELYRVIDDDGGKTTGENAHETRSTQKDPKFFVKFSLNSRILRCYCNGEDVDPLCLVPIDSLANLLDDNKNI